LFNLSLAPLLAAVYFSLSSLAYADEAFYGTIESRPTENAGIWVISG
jgi:hypothetical protein